VTLTATLGRVCQIEATIAALSGAHTGPAPQSAGTTGDTFGSVLSRLTTGAVPHQTTDGAAGQTASLTAGGVPGGQTLPTEARSVLERLSVLDLSAHLTAAPLAHLAPVPPAHLAPVPPAHLAAAGSPAPTDAGGGRGEQVVQTAKRYLGVPYVWGGESLAEGGLDCSGLVQLTFAQHGVTLPRTAREQMREGTEVPSLDQARPGDLIVTRGGAHIGIYVGDGQMIHSPRPGRTVEIRPLQAGEITTIRRVV